MAKRYVQTLDLVDDPELVDFYVKAHSPLEIWPEIVAGIKEVGITRMDIYRDGTRLVMILILMQRWHGWPPCRVSRNGRSM